MNAPKTDGLHCAQLGTKTNPDGLNKSVRLCNEPAPFIVDGTSYCYNHARTRLEGKRKSPALANLDPHDHEAT